MMHRPRGTPPTDRWQRVLTFDERVLPEILRDTSATVPGILTVVVVMFVSGLGGFIWWLIDDHPSKGEFFFESAILGSLISTGLFFVWAGLVAAMAGQLGGAKRPGQFNISKNEALAGTVRTMSFAVTPFAVSGLMFIPGLEFEISLLAFGLLLLSTTLAVRTALGVPMGRALGTNLVGFFIWLLVLSSLMDRGDYFAPGAFIWGS